ncbi:MAG: N-acetylmuramoyl-L-alanine amidase [Leptospiraceae bacterium]|nr:N-acetylmuramoyl-L-alanine amidase [Leptospiraceae bacterium]MCK6379660.1 N-acetylmuramoyl-L-alanine amidase [Leptospiraceae bacterium]NUM40114.1 N-acetylmuramoyl-L-alanine amidase [Leptospiraceae bacterium]
MNNFQSFNSIQFFLLYTIFFFSLHNNLFSEEKKTIPKEYKIVIDPGHGGWKQAPYELYGDKFDTISQKYLEHYKSGGEFKGRTEMEIVLEIGKEVQSILNLTKTESGFLKFKEYIKKFSHDKVERMIIHSSLSRTDSYKDKDYGEKDDRNALYRLYDYPDFKTGKRKLGRISEINKEKPYLVVSIHINDQGKLNTNKSPISESGLACVLAPSYHTFQILRKISMKKESSSSFENSPWKDWMVFQDGWSKLENAVADAWIYFHGHWPDKTGRKTDLERFSGFRQNMITWKYEDSPGWEEKVGMKKKGQYALDHELFRPSGKFWDRERGKPEIWKRENGPEGFGGDNHFACMEILRFINYGLNQEFRSIKKSPEIFSITKPYISTYSVPTFVNGISAYLELGDIKRNSDIYYLTEKKKETAISIAVGIFSLFHGLNIKQEKLPIHPKGKKIDFKKYENFHGKNYFKQVLDK